MSSVLSLLISLLCMISFLHTSIVVDGRHIGVIHTNRAQNFTTRDIEKSHTSSNKDDKTKVKVEPNTSQKMSKNIQITNNAQKLEVMNQNVRQNHEEVLQNHSNQIKSKIISKVVTWRVPKKKKKKKNGVQKTSFNQDYAPPKVHPPTHN
ncbi:hypothetical protein RND81_02G111500 [Saponaria officinalis]|uniref:Transmembrane protein n=1 Tax=Saponaria officinalis TaxID=3572 RepID=A0AAW1MTI8_SAPOF